MDAVREELREAVRDLSNEQLAHCTVQGAHPVAALVLHIGEAEFWWMQCNILGREVGEEEKRAAHFCDTLEVPESFAARNYSADYCLGAIDLIRHETRETLAAMNDDDLDRIFTFERDGEKREVSLRWVLHNLITHEAHHKGQITMLRRIMEERSRQ